MRSTNAQLLKLSQKDCYQFFSCIDVLTVVLSGTTVGVVASEKVNKSEILSVKLREEAINGRAFSGASTGVPSERGQLIRDNCEL